MKKQQYLLIQIKLISVWYDLRRYRHASSLQLNTLGLLTIIQLSTTQPESTRSLRFCAVRMVFLKEINTFT